MTQPFKLTESSNHHPFRLRKIIVLSSLAIGVLGVCLNGYPAGRFFPFDYPWGYNGLLGLAIYFCSVTALDVWIHNVLRLRASMYSDPKLLEENQKIDGKGLDLYFDSRKKIRVVSFLLAGLAYGIGQQVFGQGLELFCGVYIFSTLLGILQVRFAGQIRRPRVIFRDDRYYRPLSRPFWHMDYLNWYMGRGPLP